MAWFWCIIFAIGYVIMGVLTGLLFRLFEDNPETVEFVAFVWPVALPLGIIIFLFSIITYILDNI